MLTKGARTCQHIIASAAPVFNVKGFAGASMTDILQATGLEKGGLYRHFRSKEELALAAFDYAVRILEKRHDAAQAGLTTALARLQACVDVVAASINDPPLRGGCPILNTAIEADDTHLALRKRTATAMRRWQDRIVRIVDDGIASEELRSGVDAASVAAILTSALEGAIMIASLLRDPAQMNATSAHLRDWLGSLGRTSGAPAS
jgi:AcrR family transcriptional regulator